MEVYKKNLMVGGAAVLFGAAVMLAANGQIHVSNADLQKVNARTLPNMIGSVYLVLGIILMICSGFQWAGKTAASDDFEHSGKDDRKRAFLFICGFLFYILFIPLIGFFVSTTVFLAGVFAILKVKRRTALWVVLGGDALLYLVFVYLVKVPLPGGLLI